TIFTLSLHDALPICITFDSKLKFKDHINYLRKILAWKLSMLYRIKNLVPMNVKLKLYFAHFHSHLYYCNLIWGQASPTNLQPLILLQKRALRIITNSSNRAHTAPMFSYLNITPLQHIFKYRLTLMLRNINHRIYDFLD